MVPCVRFPEIGQCMVWFVPVPVSVPMLGVVCIVHVIVFPSMSFIVVCRYDL